ncbi:MAG: T9SS type A sorting domain-containing protein [Bacteroidetes bacterium]|nr:MAG: T9SS type A sorting domain-containing protein [Bacteroidota bacterium]
MNSFLRKRVLPLIFIPAAGFLTVASILNQNGPGGGYTNAPGESNCTSCHSGTLNATPANLANLTLSAGFSANGYIPDSIYTVTVSYAQAGINKFGFQITSLRTDNNAFVGIYTAGTGNTKVTTTISGSSREYIQHNSSGTLGSGSRSWTFTWRAPSTNVDTISFYVAVNATNSNGTTTGDQVYAKVFKIPASSLLPTAIRNVSKSTVCAGDTVTYYGSGTNSPSSYRWRFQLGSPSIVNTQNVVRTYAFAGTFWDTLVVTNAKGQSQSIGNVVTVISSPSASISSISPNDTACTGDNITLTANSGTGFRYLWNTGNAADTLSTLQVGQSGSYAVTVTNASGCSKQSNPVALTFIAPPSPTLTAFPLADSLCEGDSVVVTASGTGVTNYTFLDQGVIVQSGPFGFYKTSALGHHSIRVEADNGYCTALSTDSIVKDILPRLSAPVVNCSANTDTIFYTWGEPQFNYEVSEDNGQTWIPSGGSTSHRIGGVGFSTSRTLLVRKIGTGLCSEGKVSAGTCTTDPCSILSYTLNANRDSICLGDSIYLSVDNLAPGNYTFAFNGGAAGSSNQFAYLPQSITDDSIQVSIVDLNSPSCPPLVTYKRTVVESIPETQLSYDDTSFCENQTILIRIQNYNADYGYVLYQRMLPGSTLLALDSNRQNLRMTGFRGIYQVQVNTHFQQCSQTSQQQLIVSNPRPHAEFHYAMLNSNEVFLADSTSSHSRTWDFGDNSAIDTARYVTHTYVDSGVYSFQLITKNIEGCADTTNGAVKIQFRLGLENLEIGNLRIYPNPTSKVATIESELPIESVLVLDLNGKLFIRTSYQSENEVKLDVSDLAPGVYMIQVQVDSGASKVFKLLIER